MPPRPYTYRVECRYLGIPREAGPVIRDWLKAYKDAEHDGIPTSDVTRVERIGLGGHGFVMQFRMATATRSASSVAVRALTIAGMAIESGWRGGGPVPDPEAQPYYVRCEELRT